MDDVRRYVREQYSAAARRGSCCGPDHPGLINMTRSNYDRSELEGAPAGIEARSFGCGNPVEHAGLLPGETVLDLGCGAGLDMFIASRAVGPEGRVIGLDMTGEMLVAAAENLRELKNVTLVGGFIEEIPLADESVDVVLSNCVINLSPDKSAALGEAFRVLRPGGRLCVADTVFIRPVSEDIAGSLAAWSGCIAGALQEDDYLERMKTAGFSDVEVRRMKVYAVPEALASMAFPDLSESGRREMDGALASAIIKGRRPLRDGDVI
ncbi:MAG: Demethylmenaquinone methyltransferase [Synergistetes bacterium ADurb.BinA166]|nr:MAG: Demethylmenaquinone methyltransferase [Synergistetes bacterium ADurb.BinA166]